MYCSVILSPASTGPRNLFREASRRVYSRNEPGQLSIQGFVPENHLNRVSILAPGFQPHSLTSSSPPSTPVTTTSAPIRRTTLTNSRRVRWLSAGSTQYYRVHRVLTSEAQSSHYNPHE